MEKFSSKNEYSPSADAALIEQISTNDQLPISVQNVMTLADQFCHNNNSQQEVQVCALTLLRMLTNVPEAFPLSIRHDQVETLQRTILSRFGDCQLSKSTRRICGDIIRQLLLLTTRRHSNSELNPPGHDISSLPWPNLFDQLLQVADDESQDTTLRCMSLVVFAENMDIFYKFLGNINFAIQLQHFLGSVVRWLCESSYEFAVAAAESTWRSFRWSQQEVPQLLVGFVNTVFVNLVPAFVLAYQNACDVDEYDADEQIQFVEHVESFFDNGNSHLLFEDPTQYQQLCEVFMSICRRNVGKNREIVDVLCSTMINLMESNITINEFIATTPGEITKLFNSFADLMCRWLEVEYDAEAWPHSFRPLSEDGYELEEFYGFDRASNFIYNLSRIFDGKEVSTLMAQMLERALDNNNNNNVSSTASQKIPFNSAASTFQQNTLTLNDEHPLWMISASVLWCFGKPDQALVDRLEKKMYSLLNNFVLPAAVNHEHPFVRYAALDAVWRLHRRNMLPLHDSEEARSIHKWFLEILARKVHAAQDCYRVQEIAGVAIGNVFVERVNSDSAENISDVKESSIPNLFVQSIFDSLCNHESKPNFVIASHLRAFADVCDRTSSDHPLNFNDQLLPLLQHLVQKYHSILLQQIESSSHNNADNGNDEEESEFSRKARLNPSFNFDLSCLTNSIRAATRVFEFLPASEENQTVAKELTSFIVEMLETLQLRAKDQILAGLLYALEFLCTSLGENNFPNDCGGAALVDRMMPPLIHYAMLDHVIPNKEGLFSEEVSDEIFNVKQGAVDIMCELCDERGELMKQKWTSSIGDIIIHLLETKDETWSVMDKMGFDLFVAVGNAIDHPTSMDEAFLLQELAKKNLVGSINVDINISKNNNNNDGTQPTNEETSEPDPEEWKFLTKVANRVVLRFLYLEKVLAFENGFPPELGIANITGWTKETDVRLPSRTPILVACLLPHISPSIWEHFAELILFRIVRMFRLLYTAVFNGSNASEMNNKAEFDKEYHAVLGKTTTLQARRQQQEQRRQQELLLEPGSRRQRQEAADDDAETQEESTLRENQLDEDVLIRQLEQAKMKYFNNEDRVSFDESICAMRKCLKMALIGIPAARVTQLWSNIKLRESLEDLICDYFRGDLLGLQFHSWSTYFDRYYGFAERLLAEDAERGSMKNNNANNNTSLNTSLSAPLPLKTRLELIVPVAPSDDLAIVLSETILVPRMMKSVLDSDFFNKVFQLSAGSKSESHDTNNFMLTCVDSSLTQIIVLIRKFKYIRLPEHSGKDALTFVTERNAGLSGALHELLVVVQHFLDFFIRNAPILCKSKDFLRELVEKTRIRHVQLDLYERLEAFISKARPKLFIKIYLALQCKAILAVADGLLQIFPQKIVQGQTTISKETFQFGEGHLHSNILILVFSILEPVRSFIAADGENDDEEATDEERKMPLQLVDESATKLLEKLTTCEILLKQYQQSENNVERCDNNNNDNEKDAAEKPPKNSEPAKLWITGMIERITNIISPKNEKQPTTEN